MVWTIVINRQSSKSIVWTIPINRQSPKSIVWTIPIILLLSSRQSPKSIADAIKSTRYWKRNCPGGDIYQAWSMSFSFFIFFRAFCSVLRFPSFIRIIRWASVLKVVSPWEPQQSPTIITQYVSSKDRLVMCVTRSTTQQQRNNIIRSCCDGMHVYMHCLTRQEHFPSRWLITNRQSPLTG